MATVEQQKKRILVIDDEELLTKTFSLLLERSGYEVYVAKNGQDGLAMACEEKFDLLICDIRMPGLNGVDTIKAIRASSDRGFAQDLPVIFITGFADECVEGEAGELKPLAYLYKPFDNQQLLKIIKKQLET